MLTLIYAYRHCEPLLLDATTSFGTRLWNPFSSDRVAWDMLFIIDFSSRRSFCCRRSPHGSSAIAKKRDSRAALMWLVFSTCRIRRLGDLARAFGFLVSFLGSRHREPRPSQRCFLLPLAGGRRLRNFAGALVPVAGYSRMRRISPLPAWRIMTALARVETFVAENHLDDVRSAQCPFRHLSSTGAAKSARADGVYQSRFDLRDSAPPTFQFLADSPHDDTSAEAMNLPDVASICGLRVFQ